MTDEDARLNVMPCVCGRRRGLHRWGDEACPDPAWKPGNGKRQYLNGVFFELKGGPQWAAINSSPASPQSKT